MKLRLDLKLSQKLIMTPQLQQAIKLLQLYRLELQQSLAQHLLENPLLDEVAAEVEEVEASAVSEVREYIGVIAEKYGLSEEILESQLKLLPLRIYQCTFYEDFLDKASKQLAESDEDDVELIALSLKLKVPIWINDRHFQHAGVGVYTTVKLLKILKA